MTAFRQLQNLYKAQKARDPWAIAWAIVNAGEDSGENSVNPLYLILHYLAMILKTFSLKTL